MRSSIDLVDVGVHFLLPHAKAVGILSSVKAMALGGAIRREHGRMGITALQNIDLHLQDGDRLGIIGHNGAGKTTLLRVISGILPPTSGRMRIVGRVSALLSIHLGMDNYATGFENIKFRARYMGCAEEEILAQFDDIAEFSELGDYLNLPLKTYSSGMRLRLAFAIATAFQPDILVLDEWLSTGDETFQAKASKRLNDLIDRTGIFAFASHSKTLLRQNCNKGLVLTKGQVGFFGPIDDALAFGDAAVSAD